MMNNPGDYIDSTTGAFDKRYFDNWIQEKFTKGIEFHVIAVELFMLKQINKVYGSSTGDLLLVQIARELQNITGSVQVFRTTGNCFLIITDSLTEYEKNRQEIENYFKEPFETDGEKITFPAIICGIINGEKMEKEDVLLAYIEYLISLVKRADETVVIQSDDRILEGFRYEKEVEHFLKTAVDKDLFEVYYQPVFWTKEDRYITLEALSRLKHPCMGMIPPDVFIGIAEKQGMISAVGCLQLHKVCRFIKEHEYIMKKIRNVKFNLSPSELMKPGYSHVLIGIIQEYGLDPGYFQFEITETVATEYSESFCKAVEDFTNAGIGLCLDDFGSGYANLNAVLRLPFDVVKMDRSLLTGITCDEQAAVFYHSIVTVMQNMGYIIVAEGAETEDEANIREMIALNLRLAGMEAVEAESAEAALPLLEQKPGCDAAILDVMLPGMNGFSLCETIRRTDQKIGIIILSAKGQEQDKIRGLSIGADDYMTKPFSVSELLARVEALCRRVSRTAGGDEKEKSSPLGMLTSGEFVLDENRRVLLKAGQPIELTQVEFQIMELFFRNPGIALVREKILKGVWGENYFGDVKIVDVNIRRLRMKVEDEPSKPAHILTVWGYGYRWEE